MNNSLKLISKSWNVNRRNLFLESVHIPLLDKSFQLADHYYTHLQEKNIKTEGINISIKTNKQTKKEGFLS